MHKGILVYLAIFVILAIIAFSFYQSYSAPKTTTTSLATASSTATTTVTQSGTVTVLPLNLSTTTVRYSSCISTNATEPIPNGNFSTGAFAPWNATGTGFSTAPFNLTYANANYEYYSANWSGYNGMFAATTYTKGLSVAPGNLTSGTFTVTEPYLNFKIISSQSSLLYVQVLSGGAPTITTHYNTYVSPAGIANPASTFVNASIPVASLLCRKVSIKVVAGITGSSASGKNYIAVTGFYMGSEPARGATQPVNQTINASA